MSTNQSVVFSAACEAAAQVAAGAVTSVALANGYRIEGPGAADELRGRF